MVRQVNEYPHINVISLYGIQSIDNQQVYLAEIRYQFIHLLGDQVYAWNHTFLLFLKIPQGFADLDPVILIDTDLVKSLVPSPLFPQKGLDLVIIICVNHFNTDTFFFQESPQGMGQFRFPGPRFP